MENCEDGYGKHCFECKSERWEFVTVATGSGMDVEMLHEFGERQIAISCPLQTGYLALRLTKEAIKEISKGKVKDLNQIDIAEISRLIKEKNIKEYVNNHKEEIPVQVTQSCIIPPPFP